MITRILTGLLLTAGLSLALNEAALAQHHGHDGEHHGNADHGWNGRGGGDRHGGWDHRGGWERHGDRGGWQGGWRGPPGRPFARYDLDRWHGGGWRHEWHDGRQGWWWVVGPSWYYYRQPVYPYPDPYVPSSIPAPAGPMWYYCAAPAGYYPYVAQCSVPWQAVPPR